MAQSPQGQKRLLQWGEGCAEMGYLRLAEWAYQQVISHGEPDPVAFFSLGKMQKRQGRLGAAKSTLRQGLNLQPNFYLCKYLLFDSCRDDYWAGTQSAGGINNPLAELHGQVREALIPELKFEIGRLDTDFDDLHVLGQLEQKLKLNKQDKKIKELAQRLTHSKSLLSTIYNSLDQHSLTPSSRQNCLSSVELKDGQHINLMGVHDADDLIGYHLEVVLQDQLTFLPFEQLQSVSCEKASDYTAVQLTWLDGQQQQAVVPTTYHLSRYSDNVAIKEGEITAVQRLYDGLQVGLGKRLLIGTDPENGEQISIRFQNIKRLELNVEQSALPK